MNTRHRSADPTLAEPAFDAAATAEAWQEPAWLRPPEPPRWRSAWGGPVMWWAAVVLLALMSFYVYVLQEQVLRAEQTRQMQGAASGAGLAGAAAAGGAHGSGEDFGAVQLPPALQLRVGSSR
jgi:hypothetical protein